MAASYPTTAKSFATRMAGTKIKAEYLNDIQVEIMAMVDQLIASKLASLAAAPVGAQVLTSVAGAPTWVDKTGFSLADGWTPAPGTWTYASADSPTFVISVNADVTALIGVCDRIKLTQTTVKYFIVTAVGAFSGGNTSITVYGGTDFTLANAAINLPFYSHGKVPFGFPALPSKWSVTFTDTTTRQQASPTLNTWYNLGAVSLSIPIGMWRVSYSVVMYAACTTSSMEVLTTLSTANNSESDTRFTAYAWANMVGAIMWPVFKQVMVGLSAKTTYYINSKTPSASTTSIANWNGSSPLLVTAECAYL